MSEEKNSKKNNSKKHKHKRRKHYTVLPYLNYSALFLLISMVVVVPVLVFGMKWAVNTVHKAQEVLAPGYYDLSIDNSYDESLTADYVDEITLGKRLGTISCNRAGIYENVYYGTNRATMRNGVGLASNSYLPNNGGCTYIAGYSSSSLKSLYNVQKGDTIVFETFWGKFTYSVTDMYEANEVKKIDGDSIALATFTSTDAFACQNGKMYYVVGKLVDKEVL